MKQKSSQGADTAKHEAAAIGKTNGKAEVVIPHAVSVKVLSDILEVSPIEVIKYLMRNGIMANINQVIDFHSASLVAAGLGYEAKEAPEDSVESERHHIDSDEDSTTLQPRAPIITIMGHVDHGKTKLLDAIRQTNVVDSEAGSITQHIGAYQVDVHGHKITFLDTPGHEAFTAMRARGAKITDIAIIVIAADDGVMPQTLEAINHARATEVAIVVAINKIDKPSSNPDRVKQQLADYGLLIEEWGGDIVCVQISAKRGDGIPELLDNLLIVAEILELKADPNRSPHGVVVEARLDSNKGPLATVLIQTGTLKIGDNVVVGDTWGKVKAMFDDKSKRIKKAGPSTPAKVLGLNSVPQAGDILISVGGEKEARSEAQRHQIEKKVTSSAQPLRLTNVHTQIQSGQVKELNIIVKTDVQGSLEPIRSSLGRLSGGGDEVKIRIIHSDSGSITENDILLAIVSRGIVIGFNTAPEPGARLLADSEGIDIRCYQVIYNLVEDIDKALVGMLEPTYQDVLEGHAEIRAVFSVKQGKIAGVYVTDGKLSRNSLAKVYRKGAVIHESSINSLRHFKENVREISSGFECGIGIEGFSDYKEGDIIETYRKEKRD